MTTTIITLLGLSVGLFCLPYILIGVIAVAFAILAKHADKTSIYNLIKYSDIDGKPKAD